MKVLLTLSAGFFLVLALSTTATADVRQEADLVGETIVSGAAKFEERDGGRRKLNVELEDLSAVGVAITISIGTLRFTEADGEFSIVNGVVVFDLDLDTNDNGPDDIPDVAGATVTVAVDGATLTGTLMDD